MIRKCQQPKDATLFVNQASMNFDFIAFRTAWHSAMHRLIGIRVIW
jgi:hypothetical protein